MQVCGSHLCNMCACQSVCVSKPSSEFDILTLTMASTQVVETSLANNSPSQDSYHPDDLFQSRYMVLLLGSNHFLISNSEGYHYFFLNFFFSLGQVTASSVEVVIL